MIETPTMIEKNRTQGQLNIPASLQIVLICRIGARIKK
jgi:hypothetical protein